MRCSAVSVCRIPQIKGKGRACFSGSLLRERVCAAEPPPNRDAASLALPLGTSSGSCAALCLLADALATPGVTMQHSMLAGEYIRQSFSEILTREKVHSGDVSRQWHQAMEV